MTDSETRAVTADHGHGLITGAITIGLVAVAVGALFGPVVRLALIGDSYRWIQHAHAAVHRPALLLVDLDGFYRPAMTWTLAADRLAWGGFDASGFRVSTLVFHGLAALLLAAVARRVGIGRAAAGAIAIVWVASPFTDESAFLVSSRIQSQLMIAWLVLVVAWPLAAEGWSRVRIATVILAVATAAAAKETWVVTPLLVAALEAERGRSWRRALLPVGLVGLAVLTYVVTYSALLWSTRSYYQFGTHMFTTIPEQLAAFLYLHEPTPFVSSLSWRGVVATLAVVLVAAAAIRWRRSGVWVAMALLIGPTLPTLAVPFSPQRFLAIPYAGFLLLVAVWVGGVHERFARHRVPVVAGVAVVTVLVGAAGSMLVRADLADYRAIAAAHSRLLDEAREVTDVVATGDPVLVVRDERAQPLLDILREPRGLPKLPFTRHDDPYGLIDSAALFEWVLADEGIRVEYVDTRPSGSPTVEGRVLVHRDGGFVDLGPVPNVAAEAARWRAAGRQLRVVRAVPLD